MADNYKNELRQTLHDLIINYGVTARDETEADIFEHIATDLLRERPRALADTKCMDADFLEEFVHEEDNYQFIVDKAASIWCYNEARKLSGRACELHTYVSEGVSLHFLKELVANLLDATTDDISTGNAKGRAQAPTYVWDREAYRAANRTANDLREILGYIGEIEELVRMVNNRALVAMRDADYVFSF